MAREARLTAAQILQLNRNFRQSPNWPRNLELGNIIDDLMAGGDEATHEPVADLAALRAIPEDELSDRMMILCETLGLYRYDAQSVAVDDAVNVVKPTAVTTGRFIRIMGLALTNTQSGTTDIAVDFTAGTVSTTVVTFATAMTSTDYSVSLCPAENVTAWVTNKLQASFVINLSAVPAGDVDWIAELQ